MGGELDPWKLVICGAGPDEEKLRGHIMDMPEQIREKILLYGYMKQPDIIDFYSCASCLVLPSWYETWGLVVNEAMACDLPVIVSNKAGCSFDLVRNNVNGWIFDPFNVSELANLMTKMTRLNESARTEMGLRGREIISAWGLDRYCQGVMESAWIAYDRRNQ
jgi:glycosyltransferase involved in cell wall biosynthesis